MNENKLNSYDIWGKIIKYIVMCVFQVKVTFTIRFQVFDNS